MIVVSKSEYLSKNGFRKFLQYDKFYITYK